MNQHTPGPWTVNQSREFYKDHDQPYQIWHIEDGDEYSERNRFIARLSDNWSDEGQANARLIAAAPELYAALSAVNVWLTSPDLSPKTLQHFRDLITPALIKAQKG